MVHVKKSSTMVLLVIFFTAIAGIWALFPAPPHPSQALHSIQKHGIGIGDVNCKPENTLVYFNPITSRTGYVCKDDLGWVVVIVSALGAVITIFVKEKMKREAQVDRYMRNAGYRKVD